MGNKLGKSLLLEAKYVVIVIENTSVQLIHAFKFVETGK